MIPDDPVILLSYINTKLRDECISLNEFCERYETDIEYITQKLAAINYKYDSQNNKFI